jgi:glycosyltransferase involved in cell wall biosynthesis
MNTPPASGTAPGETVGLISEIPSPYRIPVFNALDERLGGRLQVFFLSRRAGRRWPVHESEIQFAYEVLPGIAAQPGGTEARTWYVNVPVIRRLHRHHVGPIVVGGYNHLEILWSWLYARRLSQPLLLWSESVAGPGRPRPIRELVKRAVVRGCDGYVVPGSRARRQLTTLGADPDRITTAPNSVDVRYWSAGARPREPGGGEVSLLFAGRLDRNKGLDLLLEALDDSSLRHVPLDVAGDGPERAFLHGEAARRGLNVCWHGHLGRERLRELYRAADIVVLPTRDDCWGLVLNEGMAAACVPVASAAAGAVGDLVRQRETGIVVPSEDVPALRSAVRALVEDEHARVRLSRAAAEHARSFTPEATADGIVEALERARAR